MSRGASKLELVRDVRSVYCELGKVPSRADYNRVGRWSSTPVYRLFGSWTKLVEAAGLEEARDDGRSKPGPEELRRLYHDEGLTQAEIGDRFGYTAPVVSELMDEHDIPTRFDTVERPTEDRLRELYVDEELSLADVGEIFGVSAGPVRRWLEEDGIEVRSRGVSETDIVRDLRSLAHELGRTPTSKDYTERGRHSPNTVHDRFGSIGEARKAAGLRRRLKSKSDPRQDETNDEDGGQPERGGGDDPEEDDATDEGNEQPEGSDRDDGGRGEYAEMFLDITGQESV